MNSSDKIQVMISSRCNDQFPWNGGLPLSRVRENLQRKLTGKILLDREILDVWINEDEKSQPGSVGATEHCLRQARMADLVIVLSNGSAGWVPNGGTMGICHMEALQAHQYDPDKVVFIKLERDQNPDFQSDADKSFREFVDTMNPFRSTANNVDELERQIFDILA